MFGGYIKDKESWYTKVLSWVNIILYHVDTMANFILGAKIFAWYIDMNGIGKKILSNTHT